MIQRVFVFFIAMTCCVLAEAREPAATSEHFAFYNEFETNLNDALIAAGVERNFGREELFQSGVEQACFEALAPSLQTGWNLAVAYYSEIIAPFNFDDRQQALIRTQLSGYADYSDDERDGLFVELAGSFRDAAAPAYRACHWKAQHAANQRWIDAIMLQLARFEQPIAARLAELYQLSWSQRRLDIDIVSTVSWAGANSLFSDQDKGHILISSALQEPEALELVFHEASHGFMLRPSPLQDALNTAADNLGVPVPDGLWHVLLFVTTGESVRQAVVSSGAPDYDPMIVEIYGRSQWGSYANAVGEVWPRYLNGELTAVEAASEVISKIRQAATKQSSAQ